ncbi:uncharacterized protein LOC108680922 [Hyalella azteca]|uniref:Uncharacterized protein LOC108680922 n=1 Tax=Hyalella azteca TaxID=294128 RepID=A0A8B7PJ20_HYAAZ|nr:uncharacterized protein LOC108680922 [Hyalella azteca]
MDIIALRPPVGVTNFISLESDVSLANGIYRMRLQHPMLLSVMRHIAANYNNQLYAANGPGAMTAVAQQLGCDRTPVGLDDLLNATNNRTSQPIQPDHAEECDWIALKLPVFLPVLWSRTKYLFQSPKKNETFPPVETLYPESLGVHYNNFQTRALEVQPGSLMQVLASGYCPVIFGKHPLLR